MNTRFLPLFSLRVEHGYYGTGEICPDFDFVLAEHSQRALAGARLLARMHAGRLHVMFEAIEKIDGTKEPMQVINGLELLIGLRLRNPYLEYFTDALPEHLPLYTNPKALDAPQAGDLIAHRFEPAGAMKQRPLTLKIYRMRDNALMWSEIQDGENMPKIDMRSWEAGCYLVTQQSGTETHSRTLILAPDLAEAGIWGAVRIIVTPDMWNSPPEFCIEFKSREEFLHYYVVAPKNWVDFNSLSIVDFNSLSITDASHPTLTFKKLDQDKFPEDGIPPTLLGKADDQIALFSSDIKVPRSATPTQHFQLKRNGDALIKNLPLPRADMPLARFVVQLSKP